MEESSVYQEIADNALAATNARLVALTRYDLVTGDVRMVALAGLQAPLARQGFDAVQARFPGFAPFDIVIRADANPSTRTVYLEGRSIRTTFGELGAGVVDEQVLEMARSGLGLRYSFLCPLKVKNEVAGSLSFHTTRVLRERERRACEAFARQAALTLENARLAVALVAQAATVDERTRSYRQEQSRRRQLEAIRDVTTEITRELDLTRLLHLLVRRASELVGAGSGVVALWDEARQVLVPSAWHGPDDWIGEVHLKLGEGLMGTAALSRNGLISNDYQAAPYSDVIGGRHTTVVAGLAQSILYQDRLIGAVGVAHHEAGKRFSRDDLELLGIFANQAASAIENARLFGEVRRLAVHDDLTELYNRRHFFALAERELVRAARYGHPLSMIMLDVDRFKQVNDTYGHLVGDQVLRGVADRCRQSVRNVDVLGRFGGEEFAIVLPETDAAGAEQLAERLRRSVAATPIHTDRGPVIVTVSVGVAAVGGASTTLTSVLDRVDAALYAAKAAGRNRVMVDRPELGALNGER